MTNHPNRNHGQTTIRLNSQEFRLTETGIVEVFQSTPTRYQPDYEARNFTAELDKTESWAWHATRYEIGAQAVLVSHTDVSPNALRAGTHAEYSLSFDLDGVPGNSDSNIKRTTGWRGTSNDMAVDAHGIVTIRKIRALKNGQIAVTVK